MSLAQENCKITSITRQLKWQLPIWGQNNRGKKIGAEIMFFFNNSKACKHSSLNTNLISFSSNTNKALEILEKSLKVLEDTFHKKLSCSMKLLMPFRLMGGGT